MRRPVVWVTGITVTGEAHQELSAYVVPICESDADFEVWQHAVGNKFQLVPVSKRRWLPRRKEAQ
jgi:hypothetical protein